MTGAVLFDLDDTLCTYRRSGSELLEIGFAEVGVDPFFDVSDYYAVFDDHAEEAGGIEEIRERCFAALAERAGRDPEIGRAVARVYTAERDQSAVDPLPGAREALDVIDHPLGLVTNGPPDMQSTKVETLGIGEHFEHVVYAGFETAAKPDPEPFERTLDALGVAPGDAVHVGNSLESDVRGAKNAGLRSAWVPEDGDWGAEPDGLDVEPDYVLDSLHDLVDARWA